MADLVAQNGIEQVCGDLRIVGLDGTQALLDQRRGIQPARLQRARHQRHAGHDVIGGFLAHGPQAVVRDKIAVLPAHLLQVLVQHGEVFGFFACHAQPVQVKAFGHVAEAPDRIQRQVDGIEFDMHHRMQQGGAAGRRVYAALGHFFRMHQLRLVRPAGNRGWLPRDQLRGRDSRFTGQICRTGLLPQGVGGGDLGGRIGQAQGGAGSLSYTHGSHCRRAPPPRF